MDIETEIEPSIQNQIRVMETDADGIGAMVKPLRFRLWRTRRRRKNRARREIDQFFFFLFFFRQNEMLGELGEESVKKKGGLFFSFGGKSNDGRESEKKIK